jgi:hypothetical protein
LDIEFADSEYGARFDLLALRWLASQRKELSNCRPVLIEMKYGDGALEGTAGVLKHLVDINEYVSNREKYAELVALMQLQFSQLDELGLITFNRTANWTKLELNSDLKPEVIFVMANHNPRSSRLNKILRSPEIEELDRSEAFDLRFFVARFAGYALHSDSMVTLPQFRELLKGKSGE